MSEAGVAATGAAAAFRLYAEASGADGQPGSIQTGIAIANTSPNPSTLTLELTALNGSSASTGTITVPGNGQAAMFLNQISGSGNLQLPFQGTLRVLSDPSQNMAIVGLRGRYNERGDFLITIPHVDFLER